MTFCEFNSLIFNIDIIHSFIFNNPHIFHIPHIFSSLTFFPS